MEFKSFNALFAKHAGELFESSLFLSDVDKDLMWETYLNGFPPEFNRVYRKNREFDCSCCRAFIKHYGNVVAIRDNRVVTLWDFETDDECYGPMIRTMRQLVKAGVRDVFLSKENKLGVRENKELLEGGVKTWHHFYIELPKSLVVNGTKSIPELTGEKRDSRNVFQRSLEELSSEAVSSVLDLIAEKAIYRGEEWQAPLEQFASLQKEYGKLGPAEKNNFCWLKSTELGGHITRIRNHSIGTLLTDLTNDVDVDTALRKYEAVMAPTNYKRPKAVFTKKMVEDAEKKVVELGLSESLGRRHAHITDITVNNVLWANRNAVKAMSGGVFEELKGSVAVDVRKYADVPGIGIDDFLGKLPEIKSLELLMANRHEPNLVSLIAPISKEAPTLFKWDNAFSWSYNGNIADSMKQQVKEKGGNVEGVLRFSIRWNTQNDNPNDYDAHCVEPTGNHIYYGNKGPHQTTGTLDVDIIHPEGVAVENITWSNIRLMRKGVYRFHVNNYSHNGGTSGFDAEIEFDGQIYEFAYHKNLIQKEDVFVAEVKFDGTNFSLGECMSHQATSKTVWGIQTNQFHPVTILMYSPNHWDGRGVGNRHYFFMLADCKNNTMPNGFYNEYLREDLTPHRKVFEALGSKMKVASDDNQLSGLGFSSTKRDSVIVKIDGKPSKIVF